MLGKWGTRQVVVSGWESTAEHDGVRLASWEDKERVLTKICCDVLMSNEVVNGACHGVAHVTVPGLRVRNQPIGDGHRGFLIYTMSDVAVKWLQSPSGVDALAGFHIALHTVDAYKTILKTADSSVGSQVTDSMEAEREGRMMIIWSAPASMTVDALQGFFDDPSIGQAAGTVVMIEPKRAYSNGRRYVLVTQKKIIDAVPDQQANMMNELVMVETMAQSFFQSQTIKFQKSRSRIERAQDKARYSTRRENSTFAQVAAQPSYSQSALLSQAQLDQMIGAFKSSMLHDVVYQQQMANALAQQLSRDFADSFGKQVGAAVVNSLQLWQQQAVIENRQEFSMLIDAGLSDACERTGTYVAQSPQRIRIDPAAHPESQRQQQRSNVRNQQQQQNLTRETEFDSPNQRMDVSSQRMHHQPNPVYSSVPTFQPAIPTSPPLPTGAAFQQQIVEAAMRSMNGGQGFQQ